MAFCPSGRRARRTCRWRRVKLDVSIFLPSWRCSGCRPPMVASARVSCRAATNRLSSEETRAHDSSFGSRVARAWQAGGKPFE